MAAPLRHSSHATPHTHTHGGKAPTDHGLAVSTVNGVRIYHCTASKTGYEWLEASTSAHTASVASSRTLTRSRKLRSQAGYRNRIELIQGFEFNTAAHTIALSPDAQFLAATGTYKPQLKVFDLDQLTVKFERHLDAQCVALKFLSEDWRKMVLLRDDRQLEVHAAQGTYHTLRIPTEGRTLTYHAETCDLIIGGAGPAVYRLNLDQGRFLAPFDTTLVAGIDASDISPVHQLLAFAGPDGIVECWDPRDRSCAGRLGLSAAAGRGEHAPTLHHAITALRFGPDGLAFAVGTATGRVALYDLRMNLPSAVKDHRNMLPILGIEFHKSSKGAKTHIISADSNAVKIWSADSKRQQRAPQSLTTIESPRPINALCVVPDSGMIMLACEQPRLQAYYVPDLGVAPSWCSFLDNMTEELEEERDEHDEVFDDYKFLTREQLQDLGLMHLIGGDVLRTYMHGFLMDIHLYRRILSAQKSTVPVAHYDDYVKRQAQAKIQKKLRERIIVKRHLPPVNAELASELMQKGSGTAQTIMTDDVGNGETTTTAIPGNNPLGDSRFAQMFADADFRIDKASAEYHRMNPNSRFQEAAAAAAARSAANDAFDSADDDESDDNHSTASKGQSSFPTMRPVHGDVMKADVEDASESMSLRDRIQARQRSGAERNFSASGPQGPARRGGHSPRAAFQGGRLLGHGRGRGRGRGGGRGGRGRGRGGARGRRGGFSRGGHRGSRH